MLSVDCLMVGVRALHAALQEPASECYDQAEIWKALRSGAELAGLRLNHPLRCAHGPSLGNATRIMRRKCNALAGGFWPACKAVPKVAGLHSSWRQVD